MWLTILIAHFKTLLSSESSVLLARDSRCMMQCVNFTWGATSKTFALSPLFLPTIAPAPSVHTPTQLSHESSISFILVSSLVKMSLPVKVPSSAEQKSISSCSFPSNVYLMNASNWAELDTSVDSSTCSAYFFPFILSINWLLMSFAISCTRRATVSFDNGTVISSFAISSPCMTRHIATAAGFIRVSPIVCGFLVCAIKYATS